MDKITKAVQQHDEAVSQSMAEFIANMEPLYDEIDAQKATPSVDMAEKGLLYAAGCRD